MGKGCRAEPDGARIRSRAKTVWFSNCAWICAGEDARTTAGREAGATFLALQIQAVKVLVRWVHAELCTFVRFFLAWRAILGE